MHPMLANHINDSRSAASRNSISPPIESEGTGVGLHPGRLVPRGSLLVEGGAADPVGVARHRDGTLGEMGEQDRRHRGVVLDEVALGVSLGEEWLVRVGDEQRLA